MKVSKKFSLIAGEFSPAETREILMNVFSSKIHFHEMRNFSMQERFGETDKTALKRIPQLKKCLDEIKKIIEDGEKKNLRFTLTSDVIINISKKEKQ